VTSLGWVGVWMLVAGLVAIVAEGAVAVVWGRRVSMRARQLSLRINSERAQLTADVARLQRALDETKLLWQPYRRALRWLSHPLAVALAQSFVRRLAAR